MNKVEKLNSDTLSMFVILKQIFVEAAIDHRKRDELDFSKEIIIVLIIVGQFEFFYNVLMVSSTVLHGP